MVFVTFIHFERTTYTFEALLITLFVDDVVLLVAANCEGFFRGGLGMGLDEAAAATGGDTYHRYL